MVKSYSSFLSVQPLPSARAQGIGDKGKRGRGVVKVHISVDQSFENIEIS